MRRVFGLGNALHGDDGVGVHVAEALLQISLPEDVEVIALGARVLELPGLLAGCTAAVLVDAARGDAPAGRVAIQRAEEWLQAGASRTSSHAADLRFALRAAQAELGVLPPTQVVTVAVTHIETFKTGLSPMVEGAIPVAIANIAHLLQIRDRP